MSISLILGLSLLIWKGQKNSEGVGDYLLVLDYQICLQGRTSSEGYS